MHFREHESIFTNVKLLNLQRKCAVTTVRGTSNPLTVHAFGRYAVPSQHVQKSLRCISQVIKRRRVTGTRCGKRINASAQLSLPLCLEKDNAQTGKCSWSLEKRVNCTTACTKNNGRLESCIKEECPHQTTLALCGEPCNTFSFILELSTKTAGKNSIWTLSTVERTTPRRPLPRQSFEYSK